MKYYKLLLLVLIITSCATPHTYLDETGKEISVKKSAVFENRGNWVFLDQNRNQIPEEEFQEKWRNKENNLVRHDYIATDTGRVATLKEPIYSRYTVSYYQIVTKLKELTGKSFPDNSIFIIAYTYRNDLCSPESSNFKSKGKIASRKKSLEPFIEKIQNNNKEVVILIFYEDGISLANSPNSPEEYFYIDKGKFLRNNLFLTSTFCGSYAIIRPNGQTLVRNGEAPIRHIGQHLRPDNWDQFFPPSE